MLLKLAGHEKNLGGGLKVNRLLPALQRRTVGPFVFLDHFGPLDLEPRTNTDVRPHPHIGLATVTYLFEGSLVHRDSLGSVQHIEPGAINWMSAGRGIVHSERTPPELRALRHGMHGLQLWVGLPQALEDSEPSFAHTPAAQLAPFLAQDSEVRLLVGEAFGRHSPVMSASPTIFLVLRLRANTPFVLPALAAELAVYPIGNGVTIDGSPLAVRTMAVLEDGQGCGLEASDECTVVVIGGAPLDGPRYLFWNFVASTKARLQRAADDWSAQRFGRIPGETEFIPLPENLALSL
jgi:redox-sensitive bicupin YhaK (pirin superfamily)